MSLQSAAPTKAGSSVVLPKGMTRAVPSEAKALAARQQFGAVDESKEALVAAVGRLRARFGSQIDRPPGVVVIPFEKGAVFRWRGGAAWRPVPSKIPAGSWSELQRSKEPYAPVPYVGVDVTKQLKNKPQGKRTWAHDEVLSPEALASRMDSTRAWTYAPPLLIDPQSGLPLYPFGPTGVSGRGESNLGPVRCQDLLFWAKHPKTHRPWGILIKRSDTGLYGMPGGIEDNKDKDAPYPTAVREFFEEALAGKSAAAESARSAVKREFRRARLVTEEVCVNEPRNTDNSWFESRVFSLEVPWELVQQVGKVVEGQDDALAAELVELTPKVIAELHGDHPRFVRKALAG